MAKRKKGKLFKVTDPEPIFRCGNCGGTNYRLPTTKCLLKSGATYCADCNGLMITYNFTATGELSFAIARLLNLQWEIGDYGIGVLGGTINEIEINLFKKLNNATSAFGKFKKNSLCSENQETLQEHRERVQRNREKSIDREIRKTIPKKVKKGKTRTEINKLVEKEKKRLIEQAKIKASSKIVSMQEYQQKKCNHG